MRTLWPAAFSILFGLTLQAAAPVKTTTTPAPAEPAYFKSGVLTLQDRIWAQTQIERVFYNHRIWPKENPGPKPLFETMVPKALLEAKVTDSQKKSAALDKFWQHPVTGEMLQAELDRMAKQTRDPATLKELFEALHNDPRLIAETLARETLSDRLIRNWYAYDTRFHAEARAKAEAIAARLATGKSWANVAADFGASAHDLAPRATRAGRGRAAGAGEGPANPSAVEYHHQIIILDNHLDRPPTTGQSPNERRVDAEEFAALKKKYSALMTSPPLGGEVAPARSAGAGEGATRSPTTARTNPLPVPHRPLTLPSPPEGGEGICYGIPCPEETPDHFFTTRVMAISDIRIEIEIINFPKTAFDEWWNSASGKFITPPTQTTISTPSLAYRLPQVFNMAACDSWQLGIRLNNFPPTPRVLHTAIWTGTEMIVWGGGYPGGNPFLNSGGRYNPSTDTWLPTSIDANTPEARIRHTAIWTGSEMIVWGGQKYLGGFFVTGGRYNPQSDNWFPTSTGSNNPPEKADGFTAIWTGSVMIIWGNDAYSSINSTGGKYNPLFDTWLPVSTGANAPWPRQFHTAVWTGNEMIIWGGLFTDSSGGRYNPTSNTWLPTSLDVNVPAPRGHHSAVWTGAVMIVWGGEINNSSGGRYNPTTDSWLSTSTAAIVPTPRVEHSAVWSGNEMIVWGGRTTPTSNDPVNTGGRYNPVTNQWVATNNTSSLPAARFNHTAIWSGTEMILWGGAVKTNMPSTFIIDDSGARYNPATDNWIQMISHQRRNNFSTIWTGMEMIIWGGHDSDLNWQFNSGLRYNSALDSWGYTSKGANVPGARESASAIWTGNEMIIWGGDCFSCVQNAGGKYNPVTDTWRPTSTTGAVPSIRYRYSAIWSGNEMIIWGGDGSPSTGNSGGRYNPISDNWIATSSGLNLPSPRQQHTAVWSGREMIIWGGSGTQSFNNGGRYNPADDTWLPISTESNVPTARFTHTAIWTGSDMIIWGGDSFLGFLNSGGRYNPNVDRWHQFSDMNAPAARFIHTAVWTGNEMIIWGGRTNSGMLNSGGRYSPLSDRWLTTSQQSPVPSARGAHGAVYTGNNMIVWGGNGSGGSEINIDGAIYTSGSVPSPGNTLRGGKSSSINLNWSTIYGAGSYNVKRCNPTATGCLPATIISTRTINQYSEPDDGISHFYAVEAVNQCGATP